MKKTKTKALDLVQASRVSIEDGSYYFMMLQYLTKIKTVQDIDTGKEYKLDIECWAIYGYLSSFGYTHGYNSIYPNQDDISADLGIPLRTLQRKIVMLKDSGFITVKVLTIGHKRDKNLYRLRVPKMLPRKRYINVNGDVLTGKLYKFDSSIFNKTKNVTGKDTLFEMVQALNADTLS